MKRRDFIVGATSSAGLFLFDAARGARPCPPVLGGGGGVSCSPQDLEADWQARISSPGVVWYHDFRNENEVNNFRWTPLTGTGNNDPEDGDDNEKGGLDKGTVNWRTGDGITGGACLETLRRAGTNDGGNWWRPFSAFNGGDGSLGSGNGRGVDDPADGGSIERQTWFAAQGSNAVAGWKRGFYGNPVYQNSNFDGHGYYIQARVKIHPNRGQETTGGKLFYFTRTDRSATSQEVVTSSHTDIPVKHAFAMYRSVNGSTLRTDPPGAKGSPVYQPGSELNDIWLWPGNQWVTLMFHVVGGTNANGVLPGPGNPGLNGGNPDTLLQVWVDWDGTKKVNSFIKIWDQPTVALPFDVEGGHNALICSGYMNGQVFSQDIWQRYDQIIFSKQFIPCPQL